MVNTKHFALSLDTLLLLVLMMAHLWFNPISNAFVVTLLAVYVILGLVSPAMPDELATPHARDRFLFTIRLFIVLFVILLATGLPAGWNILRRHIDGPATHAHDGMIQTEAAIQFLLNGKNPYTENYLNTPMADFRGGEPPPLYHNAYLSFLFGGYVQSDDPYARVALYHNAYLPFLFIGSIPFYFLGQSVLGWYDERFFYLLLYLGVIMLLPQLVEGQRNKLSMLLAFGLNFLFTFFLAEGRNDIVVLFGLVLVTFLLARRHVAASAVVLGLTLATKHSAWLFLPFYFVYLIPAQWTIQSIRQTLLRIWPLFVVVAAVLTPFLIWDAASFIDDTVSYLIGTSANSFPLKGWGFSTLLLALRVIPSPEASYPFGLFEFTFGLLVFAMLLIRQRHENTMQQMWFGFAALSFVVEFFSRFFNDNYAVFILQALVIAAFIAPKCWGDEPQAAPVGFVSEAKS